MTLMDGLELYICLILTVEFWYDYWFNSRENRIKRRKNAKKSTEEMDKQRFRERTGPFTKETEREMCDMQETAVTVQKKAES